MKNRDLKKIPQLLKQCPICVVIIFAERFEFFSIILLECGFSFANIIGIHLFLSTEGILFNIKCSTNFSVWFSFVPKTIGYFNIFSVDGNTTVKVIAGECLGTKATIETRIPIMFLDIKINRGGSFDVSIPENTNSFVYVWRGNGFIGSDKKLVTMGQVSFLCTV